MCNTCDIFAILINCTKIYTETHNKTGFSVNYVKNISACEITEGQVKSKQVSQWVLCRAENCTFLMRSHENSHRFGHIGILGIFSSTSDQFEAQNHVISLQNTSKISQLERK